MEWQNSHVVCTAPDQRKFTGAPQLGHVAVWPLNLPHSHNSSTEPTLNEPLKVAILPLSATKQIQTHRSILRERVTSQVRLLQQSHARDTARIRKLMPTRM